jgi:exoribonuclease II
VNSKAKWDYDLVQKMIEKKDVKYEDLKIEDGSKPQSEEIFNKLKNSVEILYQLTKLVRKERFESGSLMIEQDDIEFELDNETKMPKNFHLSHKNEAHSLVEELMLISNLLCAKFIYSNLKKYALIRRHPFFNDKNYIELQRYFSVNKIYNRDFDDMIEINKILKSLKEKNSNEYLCVQQKLKVLLLRAEYVFVGKLSLEELKHSSLNYDLYTHFTSPIRRYPDMIVHRQLKEIFKYKAMKPEKSVYKKFEKYSSYMDHINKRYNSARIISLKSKRLFKCLYLKNAPKKKYKAFIMDINSINNNNKKANNNNNNVINNKDNKINISSNIFNNNKKRNTSLNNKPLNSKKNINSKKPKKAKSKSRSKSKENKIISTKGKMKNYSQNIFGMVKSHKNNKKENVLKNKNENTILEPCTKGKELMNNALKNLGSKKDMSKERLPTDSVAKKNLLALYNQMKKKK